MKVDKESAKTLTSALRQFGTRQVAEDGMEIFLVEDATAAFSRDAAGQLSFQGLSFEMVGRDFHVLPNLDLVVSETVSDAESSEGEVYTIEDRSFVELTERYLLWRSEFLSKLSV